MKRLRKNIEKELYKGWKELASEDSSHNIISINEPLLSSDLYFYSTTDKLIIYTSQICTPPQSSTSSRASWHVSVDRRTKRCECIYFHQLKETYRLVKKIRNEKAKIKDTERDSTVLV